MTRGDLLCTASRLANWLATGRREMVCTSLHRAGRTPTILHIDWAFFCLRGEVDHCANCADWDARHPWGES